MQEVGLLNCSRKPWWFIWPIMQSVIVISQTWVLYHYQKLSLGKHPVPKPPSEFLPQKDHFLSLWHLHLLSYLKQDLIPDASMPRGRLETAFSWLCCKGEDNSGSLLLLLIFFPSSAAQFPSPFPESKAWLGSGWALCSAEPSVPLLHIWWRSGRWLPLWKTWVSDCITTEAGGLKLSRSKLTSFEKLKGKGVNIFIVTVHTAPNNKNNKKIWAD